jgi:hypothetical protein
MLGSEVGLGGAGRIGGVVSAHRRLRAGLAGVRGGLPSLHCNCSWPPGVLHTTSSCEHAFLFLLVFIVSAVRETKRLMVVHAFDREIIK